MEYREVTDADSATLRDFVCARGRDHELIVQTMIRDQLPLAIARGDVECIGAWLDTTLVGVAAWSRQPPAWRSRVLAIGLECQGQGHGRRLKEELLRRAAADGATHVLSVVAWENDAMINLNAGLGGRFSHDGRDHFRVAIPTRPFAS